MQNAPDGFNVLARFPRATDVTLSPQYLSFATGSSVSVMDRASGATRFQLKGLKFAYSVLIHPDETLLVVYGTSPYILFYRLPDGKLLKKLKLPTTQSQDVEAAMDASGFLWFPMHTDDLCSVLLKINLNTLEVEERLFEGQGLCIHRIQKATDSGWLLFGFSRMPEPREPRHWIARFSGSGAVFRPVFGPEPGSNDPLGLMAYDQANRVFCHINRDFELIQVEEDTGVCQKTALNLGAEEYPTALALDGRFRYLATTERLMILDRKLLGEWPMEFGFLKLRALGDGLLMAAPFSKGAMLIQCNFPG